MICQNDFRIVLLTMVYKRLTLCFPSTKVTAAVFNNDFHRGRAVDGDQTKMVFVYCKHYRVEVYPRPKIGTYGLTKFGAESFCIRNSTLW